MIATPANTLWLLACLPEYAAFKQAMRQVAPTQRRLLLALLHRNAPTDFGRRHHFNHLKSVADYQAAVPISTYQDYQPALARIGAGEPGVLTADPVLLLEQTSGSTAATKLIPYTAALKRQFQRAIAPWLADTFLHSPGLLRGQAYWSVTPVTHRNRRTSGGIPIGFEEDSHYFGPVQRWLVEAVQAVPPAVKLIDHMETFRYVTLLFLLRHPYLALLSVWNPTFLTLLLQPLAGWWPRLAADIAAGTLLPPARLPAGLHAALQRQNHPHPRRGAQIKAAFAAETDAGAVHARLWPHLRLISCWTEAHAALHVPELRRFFHQAALQPKGLLATEGVVSFPLTGYPGSVLALRSHFFEFLPFSTAEAGESTGQPLLAHQLSAGQQYEVLLTTGGGLYRYRLFDAVQVVEMRGDCPVIKFVGKTGHISDRFGEKLNEHHVRQALDDLLGQQNVTPAFAMLAFEESLAQPAYVLFIQVDAAADDLLFGLGRSLETALQANYHYRYCRQLGQLGALRIFRVTEGAQETYLAVCRAQGQRVGDIKPLALHRYARWLAAFAGKLLGG